MYAASPQDITRFLVWKDHKGKTKIHIPACKLFGTKQVGRCACPTTLSAGTVENLIGKLLSLFVELRRGREWNELLGNGNPASHPCVKQYLTSIREEQAQARVTPRQTTPFFFDKLKRLCLYLRDRTFAGQISPTQRYLFARDLAFFCLDFFAGDRASDLGRIFTREIVALPDGDGFLFHHTFGETLRGKDANTFMIKKCRDPVFCPVANLRLYVNLCDLMSIDLRDGHLFRSTNKKGAVSGKPFIGSAIANRLSLHLASFGIPYGETMHSFRSRCSITMSLIGVSPEDIARHVGWKSLQTAEYYTQTGKVIKMSHAASASAAVSVAELFRVKKRITGFYSRFSLVMYMFQYSASLVKGNYLFSEFWREYLKSHFLRISRIERHSRKIQFFFILPKNPFG